MLESSVERSVVEDKAPEAEYSCLLALCSFPTQRNAGPAF
jgi:hypothetical protein